jgi:hypothetical protein
MPVNDWHSGQLVVFWIGLVVVGIVATVIAVVFEEALPYNSPLRAIAGIMMLLAWLLLTVVGLTVSWLWFDGRKSGLPPTRRPN